MKPRTEGASSRNTLNKPNGEGRSSQQAANMPDRYLERLHRHCSACGRKFEQRHRLYPVEVEPKDDGGQESLQETPRVPSAS
jgi:hypothetical protein